MADEEVGVEPERLAQLATELENLRNVLAQNVPIIVNTLETYWNGGTGTPINLGPLKQAQARSVQDAADMRSRSNLAQAWMNQAVNIDMVSTGMATIPWDTADIDSADAQLQAQQLAAAEKSGNRAEVQAIETDIQDHVDDSDTAWLTAFYNQASPQVANLAATLNSEDGKNGIVLSAQDEKILNTFATGLAAADKTGNLSPTAISAYSKAKNLWSVGMLFKFGPAGSAYGTQESGTPPNVTPNLLAQVTTAIEMARLKPGGYTIPLTGKNVETGGWGADITTQTLAQWDPAQTMLTLATQNGAAAREVLAGPDGQTIANALMTKPTSFYYPVFANGNSDSLQGFMVSTPPDQYLRGTAIDYNEPLYATAHPLTVSSNVVGSFFNAATSAPRGTNAVAYNSAKAAMNIVDGTPPPSTAKLAAPVRQALLTTAQRYMLDLARSCQNTSNASIVEPLFDKVGNPWALDVAGPGSNTPLANFLQQIVSDPTDDGVLAASAKTAFSQYYGLKAANQLPASLANSDPAYNMAQLLGQIQTQSNNVGIQGAELTDAQHAEYNALLSFAEDQATKIPVVGTGLSDAQTTAGLLGINLPQFSTNNATNLYGQDQQGYAIQQMQINVPMVQGLLNSKVIPASSVQGMSWYKDGKIVITTSQEAASFNDWFAGNDKAMETDMTNYQTAMGIQNQASGLNPLAGG